MSEQESLLEPIKYYKSELKQKHKENVDAYFESETKESKVNPDENKEAVNVYKSKLKTLEGAKKAVHKMNVKLGFMLFFGIILIPVIIGILLLVKRSKLKKNEAIELKKKQDKAEKEAVEARDFARSLVEPLLNRIHCGVAPMLMEKTISFINFDETLTGDEAFRIEKQYNTTLANNVDESALTIQTGHLNNNPFVVRQNHITSMGTELYTGVLVVTYTVTTYSSEGKREEVRTETLHASVTKPKPFYSVGTSLDYYTTAAPKLDISRSPTTLYLKSEKEIKKYIDKIDAEETKKAQKAIKKGQSYTKLANVKFESFFNCNKRNNELEYRLLFTPLAQNNLVYYFSQKEPFGDDIRYYKEGMVNTVVSTHSSKFDYSGAPYLGDEYDYEVIKTKFQDYCNSFFEYLYYDFAFLLSIPLFNQHLSEKFVDKGNTRLFSALDTECLINKFGNEHFKHEDSATDAILKTKFKGHKNGCDLVDVYAFSYEAVPQVETVPVIAGNGQTYLVPVNYFEYIPLEKVTHISVYNIKEGEPSKCGVNYRNMDFEIIN